MLFETDKVYTFKLPSGEEFVAKVLEAHSDFILVNQPISMVIGQQGLQMIPSLLSADMDSKVRINKSSLSMVASPREDVEDSYFEATTGIKPIRRQIITG